MKVYYTGNMEVGVRGLPDKLTWKPFAEGGRY